MSAPGNPGSGAISADETGVQPAERRRDPTVRFTPGTLLAGRSFAVLGFFVALLLFAFHTSLGGKPLFGKALLED